MVSYWQVVANGLPISIEPWRPCEKEEIGRFINVTTDWNCNSSVVVKWKATNPIRVEGTDRFQLCLILETEPIIEKVQQVELKINGNRVLDPEWSRTLFTAIEAGRGTSGNGHD